MSEDRCKPGRSSGEAQHAPGHDAGPDPQRHILPQARDPIVRRFYRVLVLAAVMRYAVLVTGPAGAGKTTFSNSFITHLTASKRTAHLVNLDPAAETDSFEYAPSIDIRELISLQDVMGELGYGPNGGLVYCFE